jgi:hypothetical protein
MKQSRLKILKDMYIEAIEKDNLDYKFSNKFPVGTSRFDAQYLNSKGYIECSNTTIRLTVDGVDVVEKHLEKESEKDFIQLRITDSGSLIRYYGGSIEGC